MYIHAVYTMKDIYNAMVMCDNCHVHTHKGTVHREGFLLRNWQCPRCSKQWYHPLDLENYKE